MITNMFLQFLLLPLIALCLAVPLFFIKKKNGLIANKSLMIFTLLYAASIALAGLFGFMGKSFSPWGYLFAQLFFCIIGIAFVQLYELHVNKDATKHKALMQALVIAIIIFLGGYLMAIIFNAVSDVKFGYVAATSLLIFPLPVLFYRTYLALINIPVEIYDVWKYPFDTPDLTLDSFDFDRLMVLKIELSKKLNNRDRLRLMVKAPDVIHLGTWFKKFIDDYNVKNSGDSIEYSDNNSLPYGWIFYYKRSFLHRRRLLDPVKSIRENLVKEHVTIIAKRVIEHSEEIFYKSNY